MTRCPSVGPGDRQCERAWWHDGEHVHLGDGTSGFLVWSGSDRVQLPDDEQDGLSGCAGIAGAVIATLGAVFVLLFVRALLRHLL